MGIMVPISPAALRKTLLRDLAADVARTAHAHLTPANVHLTRKRLKKARAALALMHPALRKADFDDCDRSLRDAGRSLAPARDATVMAQTYARMRALTSGLPPRSSQQRQAWLPDDAPPPGAWDATVAHRHLRAAAERLADAGLTARGWAPLSDGLRTVYRRGRHRRPTDLHAPTEDLHAWRRHTKRYWHVLELFEDVNPQRLAPAIADARRLSQVLGEEHDLALLAERLGDRPSREDRAVLATVADRRARLTRRALKLGAKVYDERPRVVEQRLHNDWDRWRRRQ